MTDVAQYSQEEIAAEIARRKASGQWNPSAGVSPSQRRTVDEAKKAEAIAHPTVPGPGLSPGEQFSVAWNLTPEGVVNEIKKLKGPENVAETRDGIKIRQPDGKTWKIADAQDPNLAELFGSPSAAAHALKMVIPIASRMAGPLAGAAGQLAESGIEQGVSMLKGNDVMTLAERGKQVAADQALNLAGEGIGAAITKSTGAVARQMPTLSREAAIAGKEAQKFSVIGPGQKSASFLKDTQDIERFAKDLTGKDLVLPQGARTGGQEALLRDQVAASRNAGGMLDIQTQASNRGAEVLDKAVRLMNDGKLPVNAETGAMAANAKKEYASELLARRTKYAGGLYKEAEAMGAKLGTKTTRDTIDRLIQENRMNPSLVKGLEDAKANIAKYSDDFGRISPSDMAALRSHWSDLRNGQAELAAGLGMSKQGRIASMVHDAIVNDLDLAAKAGGEGVSGQAARKLQAANELWANYSSRLGQLDTTLINRIEGLADDAGPDQIVKAISQKSAKQIEDYGKMVNKIDPSGKTWQTIRAQRLQNLFVDSAGTPPAGMEPLKMLSWGKLNSALTNGTEREKLAAFAAGDKEYLSTIRQVQMLAARLSAAPRVVGSNTAEKTAIMGTMSNALPAGGREIADKALKVISSGRVWGGLSTPEGLMALRDAMATGVTHDSKTLRAGLAGLSKLAAMAEQDSQETPTMQEIRRSEQ